ncbi:unnamed protein product [Gongylonema pulchrum]|uniref:Zf-IS66 domain-containing protein n=1 Tax=Gongylonema pulchrum TaxID=637853 RepID=A0A183ERL2_9BILA|nr:unnamed protein product [Gongylonema pulchrum]
MDGKQTSTASENFNSEASESKSDHLSHEKCLQRCVDGISMRRVKRGQIAQAMPVHLIDGNTQLQYHTCGLCKIVQPKLKTG